MSGISACLHYPGNDYNVLRIDREGDWVLNVDEDSGKVTSKSENFTMEFIPEGEGILCRTSYTHHGERIEAADTLSVFTGFYRCEIDRAVVNEYTEAHGNRVNEMQSHINTVRPVRGQEYTGPDNIGFTGTDGGAAVIGFAEFRRYFPSVSISGDGRIAAFLDLEKHSVSDGETITGDWLYIGECGSVIEGLCEYADITARRMGVHLKDYPTPAGYCSWYYYGNKVTRRSVFQNIEVLDAHKEDIPVGIIQIDDGWFDCWGSWQANDKFGDMKVLADEIKAHGYIPGIWIAPFGCHPGAQLFADHPDWFVKTKDGNIWHSPALDFTVPEVREYISGVFRRISHEWGYRYIKMDIITGTLCPGVHSDPSYTALMNYRLGLQVIREAVTEDTFILGCTAPLSPAAGLVDGMRVSCDVFERWESLKDVFNSTLKRFYYNNRYYKIDADCLIIRKKENEDEECWRLCTRSDEEIKTYITAMAASGGVLMLSDKLPLLSDEQLRMISFLFPLNNESAVPLDLMESYIPGVLDFGLRGGTRTVALINWEDKEREMSLDIKESSDLYEFWSGEISCACGEYKTKIGPHCCKVYFITKRQNISVIGVDDCIVMNVSQAYNSGSLTFTPVKKGETLTVASPMRLSCGTSGVSLTDCGMSGNVRIYKVKCPEIREITLNLSPDI